MRKIIYGCLVLLSGCSASPHTYNTPSVASSQYQQPSSGKRISEILDAGLSAQPQYRQAALERQQLEYMRLESERMALQNELMRRELNQYQNGG